MIIHRTGLKKWTPRHETFTQSITNLYDLGNNHSGSPLNDYNDATTGIQGIIQEAISNAKEVRALGGEWSWTRITATDGILLNTKPLNLSFRINQGNLSPAYQKSADDLYFAQCGVSVKELNDRLRVHQRSLQTTGASNGQTIAGGLSTGTHGAAIDVGAIPDYVVGLHVITGPGTHLWLERASYPVVSESFAAKLDTCIVRNDDLFNAALVSFGSFGFIHGVMIETVPLFLYEAYRITHPVDDTLFKLMESLNFTGSFLPKGPERPYHFQVLINPYNTNNLAYVTAMYKRPFTPGYTPPPPSPPGMAPGDDASTFIGLLTTAVPALVAAGVNNTVADKYRPYGKTMGTHADFFPNTDIRGKVMSMAIGIPISAVRQVTTLLLQLNKTAGPFAGVFAYRFVKGTRATLGFTRFPATCVIELDGVFSGPTNRFYGAVSNALLTENIPHTFHWGKIFEADSKRIRKMYTDQAVRQWLSARMQVLQDRDTRKVFTNALLRQWALDNSDGLIA
jgi:FAD/FMN-containing dehydrogenase